MNYNPLADVPEYNRMFAAVLKVLLDWDKSKAILELWNKDHDFGGDFENGVTAEESAALALLVIGDVSKRKIVLAISDAWGNDRHLDLWYADFVNAVKAIGKRQKSPLEIYADIDPHKFLVCIGDEYHTESQDMLRWYDSKTPKAAAKIAWGFAA